MTLMEVTDEMQAMYGVAQADIDRVRQERPTSKCLDAVDDFCDFVEALNRRERKATATSEEFFQEKFARKYVFDYQKDSLNYHARVRSHHDKASDQGHGKGRSSSFAATA